VSAFAPMDIPDDLRPLLSDSAQASSSLTTADAATDTTGTFSSDVTGLVDATRPDVVELDDGDTYELRIAAVAKKLGDDRVRMLAYNGSIPGPTLRVRQGSEVVVRARNDGDTAGTAHWHGLRAHTAHAG